MQPFGTSCTEIQHNIDLFGILIAMNGLRGALKSYTIYSTLTTHVNKAGLDEDCYFILATIGKSACLIGGYTAHNHQFGMGIHTGNKRLYDFSSNKLKDKQVMLQNLKIIFIE